MLTEKILDEFGDMSSKILDPTGTANCHICSVTTKRTKAAACSLCIRKPCFTTCANTSISRSEFCELVPLSDGGRRNREQTRPLER
jgi:hypothetical protein